jgi:hypothetical protein
VHNGEFMGLPPTGKQIAMTGIEIFRLRDGKIEELWGEANLMGERTTWYDMDQDGTDLNLREWVPGWCFPFIHWALRNHDNKHHYVNYNSKDNYHIHNYNKYCNHDHH